MKVKFLLDSLYLGNSDGDLVQRVWCLALAHNVSLNDCILEIGRESKN